MEKMTAGVGHAIVSGWLATCLLVVAADIRADDRERAVALDDDCTVRFAPIAEGASQLKRQDRFLRALSRFDQQSRLKTAGDTNAAKVGEMAAGEVRDWTEAEIAKLKPLIATIGAKLKEQTLQLPFPDTIWLIKSTGLDEGQAAYCRGNAIVLPQIMVDRRPPNLERLLIHELFHILSSHNADLRRDLYALIGFQPCPPVPLPSSLVDRKITNPDAPTLDAYINVAVDGQDVSAVPLLYASTDRYDPEAGRTFFNYLTFRLLVVERDGDAWRAVERDGEPWLLEPENVASYLDQIGGNTRYIIHPDEILADNFAHLVLKSADLQTPKLIDRMRAKLRQ